MKHKLEVLTLIARELNSKNIKWVLGGSCMLYFRSIVPKFEDIDILFVEEDYERVFKIMETFGKQLKNNKNESFKTRKFLEYQIKGVDFDLMAGLLIVKDNQEFYFPLHHDVKREYELLNDTLIYLDSVENWLNYYQLMNRTEKVELILRSKLSNQSKKSV